MRCSNGARPDRRTRAARRLGPRPGRERHSPPAVARAAADGNRMTAPPTTATRSGRASPTRACSACTCPRPTAARASACPSSRSRSRNSAGRSCPAASCRRRWRSAVLVAAGVTGKLVAVLAHGDGNGAVALAADLTAAAGAGRRPDHHRHAPTPYSARLDADVVILPVAIRASDTVWVAVDAASLDITPVDSLDLTRQLGRVRGRRTWSCPPDRQLTGLTTARWRASPRSSSAPRPSASPTGPCTPPPSTPRSGTSSAVRSASSRRSSTGAPGCSSRPSRRPRRSGMPPGRSTAARPEASSPPRRRPCSRPRRPCRARTSASRCSAASATPGSTTRTCTTAAR